MGGGRTRLLDMVVQGQRVGSPGVGLVQDARPASSGGWQLGRGAIQAGPDTSCVVDTSQWLCLDDGSNMAGNFLKLVLGSSS
ncbi:hypothetical protein CYMTET_48436 [Cymbomonas tetramitiformis]|uniref:Uncharacterized protein n=1 Tax=Cymbomonas tetramitiformis TaxID=36881 RepID=A0AAE0BSA3_9CHLO|nr:hypothetical protein CYMTET_48436 [Cymbomonas tetramitiformis]